MKIMRERDDVIIPGFGMMEGEFNTSVKKNRPFRFSVAMGMLSGWHKKSDFVWVEDAIDKYAAWRTYGPRGAWVHKDLLTPANS